MSDPAEVGTGPVAMSRVAEQGDPVTGGGPPDGERSEPVAAEPKDIKDALLGVFNRMVEVKVVTIVEAVELDIKVTRGSTSATLKPFGQKVEALVTIFNLIDGDVINIIPPNLRDDAALRDFHTAQVDKSMAVLPANIASIVNLGKAIVREFS
jgi:hypothetical protein